jgi:hypothetical protein
VIDANNTDTSPLMNPSFVPEFIGDENHTVTDAQPFMPVLVLIASGASAIATGVGLLVYFKKRRNVFGNKEVKQV